MKERLIENADLNRLPLQRPSITKREHSSAGSEHLPYKQRVRGSNPFAPTLKTTSHSEEWLCCFKEFANTSKLGVYSQKQRALMRVCRLYALHSELECCAGLSRCEGGLLLGLRPALIGYRLYCFAVRIPLLPLRLRRLIGRLFCFIRVVYIACRAEDY